jgi:hypothetical protein
VIGPVPAPTHLCEPTLRAFPFWTHALYKTNPFLFTKHTSSLRKYDPFVMAWQVTQSVLDPYVSTRKTWETGLVGPTSQVRYVSNSIARRAAKSVLPIVVYGCMHRDVRIGGKGVQRKAAGFAYTNFPGFKMCCPFLLKQYSLQLISFCWKEARSFVRNKQATSNGRAH